jgi:hypothetical protein
MFDQTDGAPNQQVGDSCIRDDSAICAEPSSSGAAVELLRSHAGGALEHRASVHALTKTSTASVRALPPYAVSRLLVLAAAVIVLFVLPSNHHAGIESTFTTWDGEWYVSIAAHGYLPGADVHRPSVPPGADTSVDGAVAFFPLYPLIIAGLSKLLPISLGALAVAVSLAFGGAASVTFTKLARELSSEDAARRALMLFCFFPGAYILSLAYPEGLLIFLGCACLLQLRRGAWLAAGVTAGLASATRPNGLALAVACVVAAFIAIRRERDWRSLIAPILAPSGFLAFLGYLWWRTGDPWYWFRVNRVFWHDDFGSWPELRLLMGGSHSQVSQAGTDRALLVGGLLAGFLLLFVLVYLLFRAHLPAVVTSYALSYELMAMLSQALAPRPRFIFAAFPLVMALGFTLRDHLMDVALAVSAAAMVLLFLFYTLPFLQGRFPIAP